MKIALAGLFFLFILNAFKTDTFSADYYAALASEDTVKINLQLSLLLNSQKGEMQAFVGALQMKKAGLLKTGKNKLTLFEKGKTLLETAIKKEYKNAEYRFLRLVIQENCPDLLKYQNKINEDAEIVRSAFQFFSLEVKKAILEYAKKSKILKEEEL